MAFAADDAAQARFLRIATRCSLRRLSFATEICSSPRDKSPGPSLEKEYDDARAVLASVLIRSVPLPAQKESMCLPRSIRIIPGHVAVGIDSLGVRRGGSIGCCERRWRAVGVVDV